MSLTDNNSPNPRAVPGDNQAPDYAQRVTEQMAADYAASAANVASLLDEARQLPPTVEDDATVAIYSTLIKKFRDTATRLNGFREKEKEPYLRGGQAVDGFFNSLIDKVARRDRKAKPGAADILTSRVDDYNQRKLAEEQARRRREAEEAARIERERIAAEQKAAREAEEARLAAERARKVDTKAAKEEIAQAAETVADAAKVEASIATDKATEAYVSTLAKPADMVRQRTDDAIVTMGTEAYAEIEDVDLLDKAALWPFIKLDAKEAALRAWAKANDHRKDMPGAKIGRRPKTRII